MSAILDKRPLLEQPLFEALPIRHLCDLRVLSLIHI